MTKEFLVETSDPFIWLGDPVLPLMSRVPLENLLADRQVEGATDILLMGMEDIGHFLKTIGSLKEPPTRASLPKLHIQAVDPDAVAMARNCLLLKIALTINVQNKEDLSFLWCVWYNMELSQAHYTRLLGCLERMIESEQEDQRKGISKMYNFGGKQTKTSCVEVWQAWVTEKYSVDAVSKSRDEDIKAASQDIADDSRELVAKLLGYAEGDVTVIEVFSLVAAFGWIGCVDPINTQGIIEEAKAWYLTATGLPKIWGSLSGKRVVNPTMVRPGKDKWNGVLNRSPLMGLRNPEQKTREPQVSVIDVCGDVFGKLLSDFSGHLGAAQINVTFWHEDYMKQCLWGFQPGEAFDVIHTGGIIRTPELPSILLGCAPLLKSPTSVLLTTVCQRVREVGYNGVTSFLQESLGCHPLLLPTLFGVHLAEDDHLGNTTTPFEGPSLLRWTKANENERGKLCIEESPHLRKAMESFFQTCFLEKLDVTETHTDDYRVRTPLSALNVLKRLESHVLGGMSQLLTMTEELRPPWTTSREDPFHLSWRAHLAAHGYLDLARVHGSDELLCIRLNLANSLTSFSPPDGRLNSVLVLLEGDLEEIARRASGAGPLVNFEMAERLGEAVPKHLFKNFKYNEATQVVEWMMLKSDWINLAPTTLASLEPNVKIRPPMFVKKLAKVQTAWKVQQKKYSKATIHDDTDTGGDLATEILKIIESVESYSVDLKVLGTQGKITAETKEVKDGYDRTNKLELHFTDDKKRNKTQNVVFSCNIDPSSVQLTVTHQTVRAVVPKHKLWNTGLTMLPQLPVKPEDLPPISNMGMKKLLEEDGLLASMFLRPGDLLPWKHGLMVKDLPSAFRLCIEGIWTIAYKEPQVKFIGLETATDILETQLDIAIKGYYFYNDLPLMHVVYPDKLVSEAMLARGDISLKDLQQKRAEKLGYRWVPYFNQVIVEP